MTWRGTHRPRPARLARALAAAAALAPAACHDDPRVVPPDSPAGGMVTIRNYVHDPPRLAVVPGGAVLVRSYDTVPHTVTSTASSGSYAFGAVAGVDFDTGPFLGDRVIDLPATAPVGTVVTYFCAVHLWAEGEGELEIVAPPSP